MKKVLLIAVGLMFSAVTFAQDSESSENKMWIGGSAGFRTEGHAREDNNTYDYYRTSYSFGPTFGFMLNDKMAVGLNFAIDGSTRKDENKTHDINKTFGYNFEPFFRYYFAGSGNFKFYGDATINFGGGKKSWENDNSSEPKETKYSKFGYGIHPGVQYWFTDNWSMASTIGLMGYTSLYQERFINDANGNPITVDDKTSNFYFVSDFSSLKFSFFYHF